MKPKAYSYIRMSSVAQIKGDSYRRQIEASREYAAKHNLDLLEDVTFADLGVSAYKGDNIAEGAALGKFKAAVENGSIPAGSYLLIESLDRLSRDHVYMALNLFTSITSKGIKIVTIADGQVYDAKGDQWGIFYAISIMLRANDESAMKSMRLQNAWSNKRKVASENAKHGQSKIKMTSRCPSWLTLSDDRTEFIVDEEKAATVRLIFQKSLEGKGAALITRELNEAGIKIISDHKSGIWSKMTVTNILRKPAATGTYQFMKEVDGRYIPDGEPIEDYYPQIVTQEVYDAVQIQRTKRFQGAGGNRGDNQSNLFTHVAKCGYCGGAIRFENKGNDPIKGGTYLDCINHRNGNGCISRGWKYADFERSFLTFVRALDLRAVIEGSNTQAEIDQTQTALFAMEAKKAEISERVKGYFKRLDQFPEQADFINEYINDLSKEAKAITETIEATKARLNHLNMNGMDISDEELNSYVDLIQTPDKTDRHVLAERIKQMVAKIEVYASGPDYRDAVTLINESEISDDEKARLAKLVTPKRGATDKRFFTVTFKSGDVQAVNPVLGDPDQVKLSIIRGGADTLETAHSLIRELLDDNDNGDIVIDFEEIENE